MAARARRSPTALGRALLPVALLLGVAWPGWAVQVPYTGELSIEGGQGVGSFSTPGPGVWFSEQGSGVAEVTPSAFAFQAGTPGSGFSVSRVDHFEPPTMNPGGIIPVFFKTIVLSARNDAGTLAAPPGSQFGGVMRLLGQREVFIATWPHGGGFLTLPVPLSAIGGAIASTRTATAMMGLLAATIEGNPWRTGVVTVSETRGDHSTYLMASGYLHRGPSGTATLQAVSPLAVEIGGTLQLSDHHVGIAKMTLHFAPLGVCGDGDVDFLEECDDGNAIDGDGCDSNCTETGCGNRIVTAGEACDDGNLLPDDGCSPTCQLPECGDGYVDFGEACDDGNLDEQDGCTPACELPVCGDGFLVPGEECDDGNLVQGDGCDTNCTATACGNGITSPPEECDDGNLLPGDSCSPSCMLPGCGDGHLDAGEECDDGNLSDLDGCTPICTLPLCGDGFRAAAEACDDGNGSEGDGCDSNCTLSACGNGILGPDEACDDGNSVEGDGCSSNCLLPSCGDGHLDPGEECDDGNTAGGDACDAFCRIAFEGHALPTQRCLNVVNRRVGAIASAQNRDVVLCQKVAARGDPGSAAVYPNCIRTDPLGRIGAAQRRLVARSQVRCPAGLPLELAFDDPLAALERAREPGWVLSDRILGSAPEIRDAATPEGRCQRRILREATRHYDASWKALRRAKKAALAGRRAPVARNDAELAGALLEALATSPRLVRARSRIRPALERSCRDTFDLMAPAPGCAAKTFGALSECIESSARCAACELLEIADRRLPVDCTTNLGCP